MKIGSSKNSLRILTVDIPQGSLLGTLLSNVFLNDLFLLSRKGEICNLADENAIYVILKVI